MMGDIRRRLPATSVDRRAGRSTGQAATDRTLRGLLLVAEGGHHIAADTEFKSADAP
jgi:hypothetical protein